MYPSCLDDVVGQRNAKEILRNRIASARRTGEPLPHLLLTGPTGLGKSMLASVIAAELGVRFRKVAPGRLHPADVMRLLMREPELEDHDIVLIEEAHAAFAGGETRLAWLLDTLLDFTLLDEQIPRITFVLATHIGIRYAAFKGRLKEIRLEPYSHADAVELVSRYASELTPWPAPTVAQANTIARAGNRNPRGIIAILSELKVTTDSVAENEPATFRAENYDLDRTLRLMGVTRDGLDQLHRSYLRVLLDVYGGVAGQQTMQAHLAERYLSEVETLLCGKGLLRRTRAGRELTRQGRRRAAQLMTGRER